MEKIFFAEKGAFSSSEQMMRRIFSEYYHLHNPEIVRSETGKPFLSASPPFFSLTHTNWLCFAAVADVNIGIDAECLSREIDYLPVLSKFPVEERLEIQGKAEFFRHWTTKESVVKWLGGTIASDLKKIAYLKGKVFYLDLELPVCIAHFEKENHIVTLCREYADDEPTFIRL